MDGGDSQKKSKAQAEGKILVSVDGWKGRMCRERKKSETMINSS
jgi:hypothetical protein